MAKRQPKQQPKRATKRIVRDRPLTKNEVAVDNSVQQKYRGKPGLKSLLESGDYTEPMPTADYVQLTKVMASLKRARGELKISLNELAQRTGIDKAAISKLENGVFDNPTIGTIQRYAQAIGKAIVVSIVDLPTASSGVEAHVTG